MVRTHYASTPKWWHHAVFECLSLYLMGCVLPRTSQNSPSTHFGEYGQEQGPGCCAPAPSAGSLLLVNVLLYDRAKLLVGEPLFGVNLVGVLAGCFEEPFVVVGLQMVTL